MELDGNMDRSMMKERKLNVKWKNCTIFEHFNKRCFKCWGYYHIKILYKIGDGESYSGEMYESQ